MITTLLTSAAVAAAAHSPITAPQYITFKHLRPDVQSHACTYEPTRYIELGSRKVIRLTKQPKTIYASSLAFGAFYRKGKQDCATMTTPTSHHTLYLTFTAVDKLHPKSHNHHHGRGSGTYSGTG